MNDATDALTKNTEQPASLVEGTEPGNAEVEPSRTHFKREDNRWLHKASRRDWWILFLLIMTYLVWTGIIYFLEPGIR